MTRTTMSLNLNNVKARYALTNPDEDLIADLIEAAYDVADNYCNRYFRYQADFREIWSDTNNNNNNFWGSFCISNRYYGAKVVIQLHRLPVVPGSWTATNSAGSDISKQCEMDISKGEFLVSGNRCSETYAIKYSGGYQPGDMPGVVNMALWEIFNKLWLSSNSVSSDQLISRVSVPDVGSLSFDTSGKSTAGGLNGGLRWQSVLRAYRIEQL